jgi:hypothetical protein
MDGQHAWTGSTHRRAGRQKEDPVSTTRQSELRTPHVLRVRGRRTAAVVLTVAVVPFTLAACGLLGGDTNHGSAPVVIPTATAAIASANGASASDGSAGTGAATSGQTTQATTQVLVSGGMTTTKTGYIVKTQVNTMTKVATKTLPPQTRMVTQAPVTNTQTVTSTVTTTVAGPTVFVTKPCPAAPCV